MHRASYWKSVAVALAGLALSISALLWLSSANLPRLIAAIGDISAIALLSAASLILGGGLVCLWRDARETSGKPDLFAPLATRVPGAGLMARLELRFLLGPNLRPGDVVQVKSKAQIEPTLDASGALDGLPFMAEMEAYCGKVFRVHRRIDKINDMRHKTGLRRVRNTVTLTEVRCSGAHHGGCQAECQILWKESWLTRLPARQGVARAYGDREDPSKIQADGAPGDSREYVCQMTQLWEASTSMSLFDLRQDLRPLSAGNLGIRGYAIAMLTRIFNRFQKFRGGAGYPVMPDSRASGRTPAASLDLRANDAVVIRSKEEIARTLVGSRNKGLWFDREMIRYCGRRAVVRKRVNRVIHESTKKMITMKTPCVVLEDVVATGEFLRLCPQHEYIFWREIWLKRPDGDRANALGQGS